MQSILNSEAFSSLEGRTKIERLLEQGTQQSIAKALNEMVEKKLTQYGSAAGSEADSFHFDDVLCLNFLPREELSSKGANEIVEKYQLVDSTLDHCERLIGHWNPSSKFMTIFTELD